MRASSGHLTSTRAVMSGYHADGDGGGGAFYWDATSTATDDGGTVVKPASVGGAGRWLRLFDGGKHNAKWFGAKGDGSTHPLSDFFGSLGAAQAVYPHATSLTNEIDWAAIQLAVNLAATAVLTGSLHAKGGRVHIPKGNYLCNQPIDLHETSGLTISGCGHGVVGTGSANNGSSTLIYTPSGSSRFIDCRSSFGLTLEKIAIVYSSTSYSGYLVDFSHSSASDSQSGTLRECALSGGLSVDITAGQGTKALLFLGNAISCLVSNCTFAVAKQGIRFCDSDGSYSNAHVVQNSQFVYLWYAWVNSGENVVFTGNTVEGSGGQLRAAYFSDYTRVDASLACTITFNVAAKTITRSTGSWITDGWVDGMAPAIFEQTGGLNTGVLDVIAPGGTTALVLTLASAVRMTNETRTSDCMLYSTSVVAGAASPVTNATLGVTLTFAGSTITRNNGSWVDDSAHVGLQLNVTGTASNDGATPVLVGLSPTVLDYSANTLTFSASGKTITRSYGSWIDDGFVLGDTARCSASSSNNGTLGVITTLSATVMTMAAATLVDEASTSCVVYAVYQTAFTAHTPASPGVTFVNETATAGQIYQTFGTGPLTFSGNWMGDQFRPDVWLQFAGCSSVSIVGNQFIANRRVMECFSDASGLHVAANHMVSTQEPLKFRAVTDLVVVGNGIGSSAADIIVKTTAGNLSMHGNVTPAPGFPADIIDTSIRSWRTRIYAPPMQLLTTAVGNPNGTPPMALSINQGGGPTLYFGADASACHIQTGYGPLHIGYLGPDTYFGASGTGKVRIGYPYNDAAPAPTSLLHVGGAVATAYASKTANYAALITDSFLDLDATGGNRTITLPDATTCKAREYTVKRVDASGNTAGVASTGGQTFDGAASPYALTAQNSTVVVVSDGTNWRIKAKF